MGVGFNWLGHLCVAVIVADQLIPRRRKARRRRFVLQGLQLCGGSAHLSGVSTPCCAVGLLAHRIMGPNL